MKYLEDIEIGETYDLGDHCFTAEDIIDFARKYDPQPFHIDAEAAKQTHFGALCASGWHIAGIWMLKKVRFAEDYIRQSGLALEDAPQFGPSPGFNDMQWLRPIYAGETIHFTSVVTEKRASASRPQWGIMRARNEAIAPDGSVAMRFISNVFVPRRPSA